MSFIEWVETKLYEATLEGWKEGKEISHITMSEQGLDRLAQLTSAYKRLNYAMPQYNGVHILPLRGTHKVIVHFENEVKE